MLDYNKVHWLTSNTEIRTSNGWESVLEVKPLDMLLCIDLTSKKVIKKKIGSICTWNYPGKIQYFDYSEFYAEFKRGLIIPKTEVFGGLIEGISPPRIGNVRQRGTGRNNLFHFVLESPEETGIIVRHINTYAGKGTKNVEVKIAVDQPVLGETDCKIDDGEEAANNYKDREFVNFIHKNYYICQSAWK